MEQENRYIEEDEITLKELILKVQEYFWEVVRSWKWIVLISIPFMIYFLYKAASTPVTYRAELTFMVNEDEGNSMGGVSAILGQFGLGGGNRGKNNLDKILELARSRRIIKDMIFEKADVNGDKDFIANHLIHTYNLSKGNREQEKAFIFTRDSIIDFSLKELKQLKEIYFRIIGNAKKPGLLNTSYTEKTGIMKVTVESVEEDLSFEMCKKLYSKLSDFYVNKSIEKQQQTFDVMFEKVDSLKKEMNKAEFLLAKFIDTHRGLLKSTDRLEEIRLKRDARILNETYIISLKNFEIADFSLKNKTPFIQVIDFPMKPLTIQKVSKLKNLFLGSFLGIMLALGFIIIRKVYQDAVKVD